MSDSHNGPTDPIEPPSVPNTPPPTAPPAPPTAPPVAPPAVGTTPPGVYGTPTAPPPPYGQTPNGQAPYGQAPYGQAPYSPSPYGQDPSAPAGSPVATKTLSLIGMIAGIVGLLGSGVVAIPIIGSIMGLLIPAAAVVLGFLGRKREGDPAKAFWLTALITGFVGIGIALIALVAWIALFALAGNDNMMNYNRY